MKAKIGWREWDFSENILPDCETAVCLSYELSRESDMAIKAAAEWRTVKGALSFESINDPSIRIGTDLLDCFFWPEFPAPYLSIDKNERTYRADLVRCDPFQNVHVVNPSGDVDAITNSESHARVSLEIYRGVSENAFLAECAALRASFFKPTAAPRASVFQRTSDRECLRWLGVWRILKSTDGNVEEAVSISKARGQVPYTSVKGWRGAAKKGEALVLGFSPE